MRLQPRENLLAEVAPPPPPPPPPAQGSSEWWREALKQTAPSPSGGTRWR